MRPGPARPAPAALSVSRSDPLPVARADLLDPTTLAALGRLDVVSRWVADGFVSGLHRSPRKGFSAEFAEYRSYQPGDDPRYVDWKVAARSDRYVVKQFEEETNLRATLVLDVSASMAWSGDPARRLTKLAYAERLVASLALVLLRQRDAVGLVCYGDSVRSAVPPRSRPGKWERLLSAIGAAGVSPGTRAADGLERAARLVRRRGLVVLVSDLLDDPAAVERAIGGLRAAGHDVTVLHVLDPDERDLPADRDALYVDPEGGYEVPAGSGGDVRAAYRETVDRVLAEWRATFARLGVGYELALTTQPLGVPLARAFAARDSA